MNLQQHNISDNNFEQCIKCTVCTVYCPVAAVNPDYPGPKQAGPDGERLRLKKFGFYDGHDAGIQHRAHRVCKPWRLGQPQRVH